MKIVVRLPNWVGDVCMALPALTALGERGVEVHLVGKGWAADLLAAHGWPVTRLPSGLGPAANSVRALGIPRGLLLTNSFGSALQFRLAGVRAVGYRCGGRTLLLGRGVPRAAGGHEVAVFWRLAQEVAVWLALPPLPPEPPTQLGLRLTDAHRQAASTALQQAHVYSPYVVLCPLAAGTLNGRSKIWPSFAPFARQLAERGVVLVACPGPGEEAASAEALPGVRQLTGLGLGAYAALCAGALHTVANDSGPMHLAAAVDAPVIGIFGVSDAVRTRPWTSHGRTVGGTDGWPTVATVAAMLDS